MCVYWVLGCRVCEFVGFQGAMCVCVFRQNLACLSRGSPDSESCEVSGLQSVSVCSRAVVGVCVLPAAVSDSGQRQASMREHPPPSPRLEGQSSVL